MNKNMLIAKIDFIVHELLISDYAYKNGRTADHFNKLRARLIKGQKLTKKMKENLAWIEENVVSERKIYEPSF